ncbi:MAG: DUF1616 domain-containing protein [Chloroflexi bacterium]|nr:DUF1616 domain-containing protein [Chloroflexota bacterium]
MPHLLRSELFLVFAASLCAALLALLEGPFALRLPLGMLAVLLFPGHSLCLALFPRSSDLDDADRMALSLGTSLAAVTVLSLLVNYSRLGLTYNSLVGALTVWTALCCGAAAWRRRGVPADELPALLPRVARWREARPATKLALAVLLAGGLLSGAGLALTLSAEPALTEFYVLSAEKVAEGYPRLAAPGDPLTVVVGIANREPRAAVFTLRVASRTATLATAGPLEVGSRETWESPITFSLKETGKEQEVRFLLFREGDPAPFRQLQLWIDVVPPGVAR